jgi:hypothetical protein
MILTLFKSEYLYNSLPKSNIHWEMDLLLYNSIYIQEEMMFYYL